MRIAALAVLFSVLTVGCTSPGAKSNPPHGLSANKVEVATYSSREREAMQASLAKLVFPVEEGTVAKLLPHPIKVSLESTIDGMPNPKGVGRIHGKIVEYWLNEDYLLKVSTAYFPLGDHYVGREVWAVVLTKAERGFLHPFYLTMGESAPPISRGILKVEPVVENGSRN